MELVKSKLLTKLEVTLKPHNSYKQNDQRQTKYQLKGTAQNLKILINKTTNVKQNTSYWVKGNRSKPKNPDRQRQTKKNN